MEAVSVPLCVVWYQHINRWTDFKKLNVGDSLKVV